MFSWEIQKILIDNNYNIDSELYSKICSDSTQINHIKFNAYDNKFEMWDNENNYWKFTVYRKDA